MTEESFLLVNLKEERSKDIAQVMSNKTARKILELLAEKKGMTETAIAKELNSPLPTIHYNLQQLMKAELIVTDEFHYSQKGKEVNHYSLANKFIIIAPAEDKKILKKLKKILPVVGIMGGIALIMEYLKKTPLLTQTAQNRVQAEALSATPKVTSNVPTEYIGLWFFIGGVVALLLYILIKQVKERKR